MATQIMDAYIEIRTNQAKFSKELKSMEATAKSSTDRMKKNFDRIGKGVSELSRTARLGFLAMSAAIAGTVYAAAKYEKEMANVSTMLTRKAMPIMEKYKDIVGKMGIIFGESTETLSKGLYDILSASIRPEKALKVLAVSAKAAAAGLTDTGVAADAITTIINSYGYAAEDASMISDKLFTIIARGKTTFAELGPNIGKVAATAAMAGLSFDDLGATIATVTRAGIRTEMAMTAINGVLKVFIKPTDEAKEAAREFGLELDTNTLQTIGFTGVLEKLNGATAEQLALIFPEIEGLKGLAAAVGDLTGYTDDYRAMLESAGATQEAYLKQTNTLTFTFNQLKEAGKYLAVQVGEIFTPIISQAIKKITDQAIKLGQAIKGLTSEQKDSVAQMVLFGTAVLGAIGALSLFSVAARLVMAAGSVIAGVLGLIFSPLGLLIVGIGALVLAWTLGWKKIKEITSKLVEIVVMPTIKFVGEKIENLADFIQEKLGIPEEARKGIWELTDITANIDFFVKLLWGGIVNIVGTIKDWVIEKAKLDDPIGDLVASVAEFLIELPDPAKWFFKIGTRVWEYASLGMGIWWAAKGLLSAIKFAPIALPALLPIIIGIGLALVGIDVLGNKLKEKLDEAKIDELLTAFSVAYPSLFKLSVGIKEVTGLELPLLLAYIDEEWKGTAAKLSLIFLAAQIPLKILWDIDLRTVFTDFWEDTKEVLRDTWDRITWPVLSWDNFITTLSEAWDNTDWSWFGFDKVKEFFKDIWESFDWSWLNWDNFLTSLQEAWDNTDWGWFGNALKWLVGDWGKKIEEAGVTIEAAADEFGIDALYLAAIRMTERGGEGIEMGILVYSKKFKDELKKMYPDIAEGTKQWQMLAAAKSTEFYWKEFKKKFGIGAKVALKDVSQDVKDDFIEYMGKGFCPTNTGNKAVDSLNKNWVPNMKKWTRWLEKEMKSWGEGGMEEFIEGMEKKAKSGQALSDMERATLKLLKPLIYTSPGYFPLAKWGGSAVEEFKEGMEKEMTGLSGLVDKASKMFMPIINVFKAIFAKAIGVIKEFDEEAGTELENFVNETLGLIDDMFKGIGDEGKEATDTIANGFVGAKGTIKVVIGDIQEYIDELAKKAEEASDRIKSGIGVATAVMGFFADAIEGAKEGFEALETAFLSLISQIPLIGGLIAGIYGLAKALGIVGENTEAVIDMIVKMGGELNELKVEIRDAFVDLSEAFKDVGISLTGSIEDAERAIKSLIQTQEDLALSTREKLIKELDNYYDYRVLKEMDLDALLALSAETRLALETGTLEEIAESAEEAAEREKDAKVSTLQAIEDAYAKESALIDKKIALLEIEIKLLMAAALVEQGKLEEASKLREEAIKELEDLQAEWEGVEEATEGATDKAKKYGKEGKGAADDAKDAFGRTRRQIEDLKGSTNQARIGIERWGKDGERNAQKITDGFKEARTWVELWGKELNKIPKQIDFDIVGELTMPYIPDIKTRYFDIIGRYQNGDGGGRDGGLNLSKIRQAWIDYSTPLWQSAGRSGLWIAQNILEEWASNQADIIRRFKSAQIGIPYIPRTMPVVVHKKEAILTASQAEEWRAGRAGGIGGIGTAGSNNFNIRILHTGDIRSDMDENKFMKKLTDRITEKMRRP